MDRVKKTNKKKLTKYKDLIINIIVERGPFL